MALPVLASDRAADGSSEEARSPPRRILDAIMSRDSTIERQEMVMTLASKVLREASVEDATGVLIEGAFGVLDCERAVLFLKEDDHLIAHRCSGGVTQGCKVPLGVGVAGRVAASGRALNFRDLSLWPELLEEESRLVPGGYLSHTVLAVPIFDDSNKLVGVMQVTNKKGTPGSKQQAFDASDERLLSFLLALTAHQLRLSELAGNQARSNARTESVMSLVDSVCASGGLDEVLEALSSATRDLIFCQCAFVFMQAQGRLVCFAGTKSAKVELTLGLTETFVEQVMSSGRPLQLTADKNPEELARVQELIGKHLLEVRSERVPLPKLWDQSPRSATNLAPKCLWPTTPMSVLCFPVQEGESHSEAFGIIIAVNRAGDILEDVPSSDASMQPRYSSEGRNTLGKLLRSSRASDVVALASAGNSECELEISPVPFSEADEDDLNMLVRLCAPFIKMSRLYDSQRRTTLKQESLLRLVLALKGATVDNDQLDFATSLLEGSLEMFECERCTLFIVDFLNGELVGQYRDEESTQLQALRVPMKGIAGAVATTNRLLNIRDAWSDVRFSKETDLRTGFHTNTLLCAPLSTSTGKVVAVLQCVNKARGEFFSEEDERLLLTVSALLTDMLQRLMLAGGYSSFVKGNDNIHADVKDLFSQYDSSTVNTDRRLRARSASEGSTKRGSNFRFFKAASALTDVMKTINKLRRWDLDTSTVLQEPERDIFHTRAAFHYLGLLQRFHIPHESLDKCTRAMKSLYKDDVFYHNWLHAFSTMHAVLLLLDSEAISGLLPETELLTLLFSAMGHDIEHPGYTNTFLIGTRHKLAVVYNDMAVLESHHASVTNSILEADTTLLRGLTSQELKRVRTGIVKSILATDMALHSDCIKWLETECPSLELQALQSVGIQLGESDAVRFASILLHIADLIHPSLPWFIHKQRSIQIANEFYKQFHEEEKLGLPTLPFMGKDPNDLCGLAPIQTGFIQFVINPLWSAINGAVGDFRLKNMLENTATNRAAWQQLADGEEVDDEQPFESPSSVAGRVLP